MGGSVGGAVGGAIGIVCHGFPTCSACMPIYELKGTCSLHTKCHVEMILEVMNLIIAMTSFSYVNTLLMCLYCVCSGTNRLVPICDLWSGGRPLVCSVSSANHTHVVLTTPM